MDIEPTLCVFCGQESSLLCQRCYDSYCSIRCQVLDWAKHKMICTPLPQLIPKHKLNLPHGYVPTTSVNNGFFEAVPIENLTHLTAQYSQPSQQRFRSQAANLKPMRRPRPENINANIDQQINPLNVQDLAVDKHSELKNKIDVDNYNENNLFKTRPIKLNNSFPSDVNKNISRSTLVDNNFGKKNSSYNIDLNSLEFALSAKSLNSSDTNHNLVAAINTTSDLNNLETPLEFESSNSKHQPWKIPFEIPKEKFFYASVQCYDSKQKIAWLTNSILLDSQVTLLRQINSNLNKMAQATKKNICQGSLYAAKFDDLYYRALCLEELNSSEIKLRLIDYGNVFSTNYEKLKLPIPIMQNLNCFAFCVYYPNKLNVDKKIKIKVFDKILDPIIGDIFLVEEDVGGKILKFEPVPETIEDFSVPTISALKTLPNEFDLKLINFTDPKTKKTAFIQFTKKDLQNELKNMNEILNSEQTFKFDLIDTSKKGDFIVGRYDKLWKRGIVVDRFDKDFLIFLTDFGEIAFVEQLKQIPADYKDLPYLIGIININKIYINEKEFYMTHFVADIKLKIKNFSNHDSSGKCYLFEHDNKLADVTLNNFDGNLIQLMQNNLWYMNPRHHNIVRITNVIDYCTIHITIDSICDAYKMKINALGKSLEEDYKLLQQNPMLETNLVVIVKINLSEYLRCRIVNVKTDECEVEEIDSGKIITVKNDLIFAANDFVKLMPVGTAKYTMNILNKIQPTNIKLNKALLQLKLYSEQNQKFILNIENPIEEGIVLSSVDDNTQTINKKLIPLLFEEIDLVEDVKQNIKVNNDIGSNEKNNIASNAEIKLKLAEKKYYLKDIVIEPIKCGENVELLILDNSQLNKGIITAGNKDLKFIEKLFTDYQDQINKHCKNSSIGTNYLPEVDELCLAVFDEDGQWYRAIGLGPSQNGKSILMFLDYGNVIATTSDKIRKFDQSFLYKSLANTCWIEGFPAAPNVNKLNGLAAKIFKPNTIFTTDRVTATGDCEYSIQFGGIEKYFEE